MSWSRMHKTPLGNPGWICHDELGEELGEAARILSDSAISWPFLYGLDRWSNA